MQKILIVEDDPIQLEMLYETVHSRYPAWEIKKGSSLEAAQAFLQESVTANEYFTLFLLDIQLSKEPGDRNGFQLAQSIREISVYYKTPILFLTSVSEELSRALTQFHCYNFITKPYQKETVLEQLRQMLLTGYLQDTGHCRHAADPPPFAAAGYPLHRIQIAYYFYIYNLWLHPDKRILPFCHGRAAWNFLYPLPPALSGQSRAYHRL